MVLIRNFIILIINAKFNKEILNEKNIKIIKIISFI